MPEQPQLKPESRADAEERVAAQATKRARKQAASYRGKAGELPEEDVEAAVLLLRAEKKEQDVKKAGEKAIDDYRISREVIASHFPEVAGMPEAEADALLYEKYRVLMEELDVPPEKTRPLAVLKSVRRYGKTDTTEWEKVLDILARGLRPGVGVLYRGSIDEGITARMGGLEHNRGVINQITPSGHITLVGAVRRDIKMNPFDFDVVKD